MSACYSVRSTNKGGVRNDVAHHRLLGVAPLYSYAGKVLSINGNTSIGYQLHNIQRRSMMMAATGEEIVVEVPAMGDSITEGTVVQWLKEEGDTVAEDEVISPSFRSAIVKLYNQNTIRTNKQKIYYVHVYITHRWWLFWRLIKFP